MLRRDEQKIVVTYQQTPVQPVQAPKPGVTKPAVPHKPMSRPMKIGCGVFAGLCVLVLVIAIIGIATSANSTSSTQSSSTSSSSSDQSRPSPAATLTIDQQINQLVQNAGATGQDITSKYDASSQTVTVSETTQGGFTNGQTVDGIKIDCFDFQRALWTSPIASQLSDVQVSINGQLVDAYGHTSTGVWGSCELTSATAAKFVWNNLTWDSAWGVYDNTFIRPDLTS